MKFGKNKRSCRKRLATSRKRPYRKSGKYRKSRKSGKTQQIPIEEVLINEIQINIDVLKEKQDYIAEIIKDKLEQIKINYEQELLQLNKESKTMLTDTVSEQKPRVRVIKQLKFGL